ncbi:pseudouridine synthase [Roseburia sp. MSJ-14]|uniref:pseudouridine synthase n=1 Tax=Roseburia sp. MSJ-14 TaxID=2841514 RepID=UPI001C12711B|nr:pseudouridine synthase [Roseburia sp. MSJ-14]MBU5474302.1 rRNA pseudouridine synthase [Roseburia sp. MSJ-14]
MKERLDKFISSQTALSRKEAQKAIRDKRVTVNGELSRSVDIKIDTEADAVALDGKALTYQTHVYYMMNKPSGIVSATEDRVEKTVIDLLPPELRRKGLFPAGRLDKDTTGLLILTDDGDYAHRMLSPKKHVKKRYIATLDRTPDDSISIRFEEGIVLKDGTVCKSGQASLLDGTRVAVEISEGKYHQVKRMFAALGYHVEALERVRIGALSLDGDLSPGEVRKMTKDEADLVFSDKSV